MKGSEVGGTPDFQISLKIFYYNSQNIVNLSEKGGDVSVA
jgi:hypothetical protein